MAGFQLTLYGRIWVTPEGLQTNSANPIAEFLLGRGNLTISQ
jgi:hypothetical protein